MLTRRGLFGLLAAPFACVVAKLFHVKQKRVPGCGQEVLLAEEVGTSRCEYCGGVGFVYFCDGAMTCRKCGPTGAEEGQYWASQNSLYQLRGNYWRKVSTVPRAWG